MLAMLRILGDALSETHRPFPVGRVL